MTARGVIDEAVILAGGLGTRLRSVVSDAPKPLAPIAGTPFLDYVLRKLAHEGVRRAVLSVGYKHEMIQARYGRRWGDMDITYHVEESQLGTGGGLASSMAAVVSERIYALNGDTLLNADYTLLASLCARIDSPFGLFARVIEDTSRYGVCLTENSCLTGFTAGQAGTSGLINAGVYCLRPDVFDELALQPPYSLEADWLPRMAGRAHIAVQPTRADFIDIGVPESFVLAQDLVPRMSAAASRSP